MKKNITMRLSAVLLVAVLLTTCVISGTWAKYTTSDTANDSARVAKWGVTVDVASDAFKEAYAKDSETTISNTVVATEKVLAPGTKGTLATVKISGTPEVAVEVVVDLKIELTGWMIDLDGEGEGQAVFYCPLTFKVGESTVKGSEYETADALIAAIEALVDAATSYEAGANLAKDITLSWGWTYFKDNETDVKDTLLGGTTSSIKATITASVTQID